MSFQLLNEIEEWEEGTDKLLVQLPIVGTMVRKWWYDPARERPVCRLVEAGKFIVNDKVKTLGDAPRCTEEIDALRVRKTISTASSYSGSASAPLWRSLPLPLSSSSASPVSKPST